uniref:RING-type domain-containing protein n=1 Tax=Amphora coffeiformis TaxID=265554 RepID=A0A7S3LHN1_9STRA|mmetsp:Transcript_9413/g.17990  ORF Transcript_9413/g.17990 Transcript_9413/m.17990 type:complete len:591 (+) Transcript_9413:280-2052(+)|eukprot:scaffold6594_cov162-Amphora_coffeaeformis.AAC.1
MAATSFSFHCMICYEGFDNSVSRYPVVLPCGHTYVCNACGERLDRCMECRTPLYVTFDPNEGKAAAANPQPQEIRGSPGSWNRSAVSIRGRGGASHLSPNPQARQPPKVIKKRIPLPKNVVLLSLIEATELATVDVHNQFSTKSEDSGDAGCPPTPENRPDHKHIIQSMQSLDEEERNEEEKIQIATSLSVGAGGTYAVAAKEGLTMFPQRPPKQIPMKKQSSVGSGGENESDVDDLVDDFQRSHFEPKGSHLLDYGDRVQIVSIDKDGWAKLARGYGYVSADKNSIVKVGGAVDRACRLEAMLRIVSQERKRLRTEQSRIDNSFIRLMNELQHSLDKDEDLTVICRSTFMDLDTSQNGFEVDSEMIAEEKKENRDSTVSIPRGVAPEMPSPSQSRTGSPNSLPFYPPVEKNNRHRDDSVSQTSLICFSPEEFLRPETIAESFSMNDVTASARELLRGVGGGGRCEAPSPPPNRQNAYPSQSEMLAGARAWRERHGRPAATGIDFRTGMSGHSALLSSKPSHPHEFLENDESIRKPLSFRMSSHTGLTMGRKRNSIGHGMASRSNMWIGSGPRTSASPSTPKTYRSTGTP